MSVISSSTPGRGSQANEVMVLGDNRTIRKKVLEEDEYLGRMAKIIKRDFFSNDLPDETTSEYGEGATNRTEYTFQGTPGTDRTQSSTSTVRSRRKACSLGLNVFLEKYTSEDNDYFDKLQRKELRRYKAKYPWLYRDKDPHNKQVSDQLKLLSVQDQAALAGSSAKMIDWPHNPMNSLFYPPSIEDKPSRLQSTVNYASNKYTIDPLFKIPLPPIDSNSTSAISGRLVDKIGVDGKLLDGSDMPSVNGYSYVPPPETSRVVIDEQKVKTETNKFYIPVDSPRDELAHRIYQEKVAKSIRTPRGGTPGTARTSASNTPSSRRSYADFSFSPERIKTPRSKLR